MSNNQPFSRLSTNRRGQYIRQRLLELNNLERISQQPKTERKTNMKDYTSTKQYWMFCAGLIAVCAIIFILF